MFFLNNITKKVFINQLINIVKFIIYSIFNFSFFINLYIYNKILYYYILFIMGYYHTIFFFNIKLVLLFFNILISLIIFFNKSLFKSYYA